MRCGARPKSAAVPATVSGEAPCPFGGCSQSSAPLGNREGVGLGPMTRKPGDLPPPSLVRGPGADLRRGDSVAATRAGFGAPARRCHRRGAPRGRRSHIMTTLLAALPRESGGPGLFRNPPRPSTKHLGPRFRGKSGWCFLPRPSFRPRVFAWPIPRPMRPPPCPRGGRRHPAADAGVGRAGHPGDRPGGDRRAASGLRRRPARHRAGPGADPRRRIRRRHQPAHARGGVRQDPGADRRRAAERLQQSERPLRLRQPRSRQRRADRDPAGAAELALGV